MTQKANPISERKRKSMTDISKMTNKQRHKTTAEKEVQFYNNFLDNAIKYTYGAHDGTQFKNECNGMSHVAKMRQARNNAKSLELHALRKKNNGEITQDEYDSLIDV